jgi:NifU-like protein involved in Fe-S cluster formation
MHCSVLAQEAIEAAINNYKEKSAKKQTSDEK